MLGPVPAGLPVVVILIRASRGQARGLLNKQEDWANVTTMRRQSLKKKPKTRGKRQLEKSKSQDDTTTETEEDRK